MDSGLQHYIFMYVYIHCFIEYKAGVFKAFEWFCFSLKYKVFVEFSKWKICTHGVVFLILKDFASLRSSFFAFGKILPHPREFDHQFCPGGRESDKKIARVAGIRSLKNIFPGVAQGAMYPVGIDWDKTN